MSYDLLAWPVDRQMTSDEAIVEISERSSSWKLGVGRDRRIDAFAAAVAQRFPKLGTPRSDLPIEFDVHRTWVFIGIGWSYVTEVVEAIAPIAFAEGLALYDPQRELVAMPRPFADTPMGTKGIAVHERLAERAIDAVVTGAGLPGDVVANANDVARQAGFVAMSPLGFEITPDLEAEVLANPLRVPTALQTPERKAELIRTLISDRASAADRHRALAMLGGWDPDADVRAALRPVLDSDDAFAVGFACSALARQRSKGDLLGILAAVRRMSPADGGTAEAMSMPLEAALQLAAISGADKVAEVKRNAREWLQPPEGARRPKAGDAIAYIESLIE